MMTRKVTECLVMKGSLKRTLDGPKWSNPMSVSVGMNW